MLDRKTSFEQTQEYIEPYSQSNSRADRGLLNASQPQSLSTLLTASHDELRKKGARPTSMQSYVQPITSARRIQRPNSNQSSGGLNKSTYVRNTSAFSVVETALANGRSKYFIAGSFISSSQAYSAATKKINNPSRVSPSWSVVRLILRQLLHKARRLTPNQTVPIRRIIY